jgi:hypothetical protein
MSEQIHLGTVHEISIETSDAPGQIKDFFKGLNSCTHRLHAMKKRQIDPNTDPPMPKVVWKLLAVCQSIIYRAVELENAVSLLINAQNLLGALIMTRTIVELMVFVGELRENVARGVDERDLSKIDAAIMSTNFSTRWEEMPEEIKARNILTLLERFDRVFMGEKKNKPTSKIHAILSEFTHPNWVGMAGFFGVVNYESRVESFSVEHRDKPGLYVNVAGGCICLPGIEYLLREIGELVPQVWTISEDDRLRRRSAEASKE